MKYLLSIMTLLPFILPVPVLGGCSDAVTNGFDCYRYALRATRDSSWPTIRDYAERSRLAAEEAQNSAEECACYEAEMEFQTANRHARDAVKAEILEKSKEHLQLLLRAAKAGTEAAESCGN